MSDKLREALRDLLVHEGERVVNGIGLECDSVALEKAKQRANEALADDDAARGTMRERFEAWCSRNGYPTHFTPEAECGVEGGPIYNDTRTHAAWWAYREGQASRSADDAARETMREEFEAWFSDGGEPVAPDARWAKQAYEMADALRAHLSTRPQQAAPTEAHRLDYSADAEHWGPALNAAGWAFLDTCPEKSTRLFNNVKASLRAAIKVYIAQVGGKEQGS